MSKYLDSIGDETNKIRHIAYELDKLSTAFDVTGNEAMAEEMAWMSVELVNAQKAINNSVSENINERLEDAKQGIADTFSAIISTKRG